MRFPNSILRPFTFLRQFRNSILYITHKRWQHQKQKLTFSYYKIRVVFFEFEIVLKTDPNSSIRGAFYIPVNYIYMPLSIFSIQNSISFILLNINIILDWFLLFYPLCFFTSSARVVLISHTLRVFSSGPIILYYLK
jgi:hypothetical protein